MNNKTLFIIGAGAGVDIGMPTGSGLAESLVDKLNIQVEGSDRHMAGNLQIFAAISCHARQQKQNLNSYLRAAQIISSGIYSADSIDSFMDKHYDSPEIQLCGKIAIVVSILEAERGSCLYLDPNVGHQGENRFHEIEKTWLGKFLRMFSSGIRTNQVDSLFDKVSIINFNYDRCLEHFLVHAVHDAYAVDLQEARRLVDALDIVHPYGAIGPLEWAGRDGVPFGHDGLTEDAILRVAQNIRTFYEQVEQPQLRDSIDRRMSEAQTLVFLGFGYHRQNLDLLTPKSDTLRTDRTMNVYGTAFGLSDSDRQIVFRQVQEMVLRMVTGVHLSIETRFGCSELFDQYRLSLSIE